MTPRVVRPAELPEQRGPQHARALARPGVRPSGPGAPRPARRAPRIDWSDIADSWFGFLVVVVTVAAAVVAIGVVGAAVMGF